MNISLTVYPVALVGAGPGNPGLLTLRAAELLARADLVLYDRLVPVRLLDHVPARAQRICVDSLHGTHPERWPEIYQIMIDGARQGQRVVRLKGGDPFVFGRGGEEAEALRQAGIPYEIVPGVTAALGAGAFAGIPLTHRRHVSAVAFVTGHEKPDKTDSFLDWPGLARFPGTLVVYMGMGKLPHIVEMLIANGKPAQTPAAAVHWATTGRQRTVTAPLGELPAAVQQAALKAPSLVIIGSVVSLREELAWFESRPLLGKRILITRPRHQAGELIARLEELGAVVSHLPAVEIREPDDWTPVDRALGNLSAYQWLVFTSANGVDALISRLRHLGRDLRALGPLRLAVIGPATADALRRYHLEPDLVPPVFDSESLARALGDRVAGQRVLLARADRGREVLREQLANVAEVEQIAVYSQVDAIEPGAEELEALRQGEIDFITLTSSNIARSLVHALDDRALQLLRSGAVQLVSISPVTSAAIREMGFRVAVEAREFTAEGVVQALLNQSEPRTERSGVSG
ncbi:MAG TPA: uroporphyrinogen-III C-methyltransferase [Gemmataceae bacterium]|nr:uroporphyrinogen-III C-methyltransferase [Gemmataceae bacterium]